MFNFKWGGIAAGAAFVLSLALGLFIGHAGLHALLRAAIFAALFFGLGTAAWTLINTFIPELLSSSGAGRGDIASNLFGTGTAGSQVNITVDDDQDSLSAALPEGQEYGAAGGELDDIGDLFRPKDIDQTPATGYNEEAGYSQEEPGGFAPVDVFAPATEEFASAFSDDAPSESGEEETGEFSMDFNAFIPGGLSGGNGEGETEDTDSEADPFSFLNGGGAAAFEEPAAPERKVSSRNKPMQLEGDFDAREIAAGLRTVLQKDKK